MKILHVAPNYLPAYRYGGPIYSVHGLCRALVAAGHECQVYTTNVDGEKDSDVPLNRPVLVDGVKVTYFKTSFLRRIFHSPDIGKAIDRNIAGFDLLHLHSPYVWPTWAAASRAVRANKPYVMMTRGMLVKDLVHKKSRWVKLLWIRLIEKKNLEQASLVQFTTDAEAEQVKKFGFKLKKTIVLGHGVDEDAGKGQEAEEPREDLKPFLEGKPFLLYVGRISWEKGLDRLIRAMADIKGISLVLVGNDPAGYTQKLLSLARASGVADRIFFAGPYYGSVKRDLYRKASAFVLPSYSENFGNVVLEAMIQGCPVVVTANVGLADFVRSSRGGLVAEDHADGLAQAVNQLLSDPGLCAQMRESGPKAVRANYSWAKITREMVRCYEEIIGIDRQTMIDG